MLKRLLVAVGTAMVLTSAQSITIADAIRSPIGTGIAVARWIFEGSEKVLYVEVIGEGNSVDSARQQGFRLAVEHAVGTVVSSETEVRNDRQARDEIITYASGYVDRFEVVEQQQINGRVLVNMKIWVRSSRIANRLLNKSATAGGVEGGRISTQIQTLQYERSSGDRLLKSVLADFPQRAFFVHLDKTRVIFDENRNGQLEVKFHLQWSREYLDSISEALTAMSHRPDSECGGVFGCRNISFQTEVIRPGFGSNTRAWFTDNVVEQMLVGNLINSGPSIRIVIVDTSGREQFKQCFSARELNHDAPAPLYFVNLTPNKIAINGTAGKWFNISIDLSRLPTASLDQVKVDITRKSNC